MEDLHKVYKIILFVITCLAILLSINEVFLLGLTYHSFTYYYALLAVFLSSLFIIFPGNKAKGMRWYDLVLSLLNFCSCIYMMVNGATISELAWAYSGPPSSSVVSLILFGTVIEAIRRVGGKVLFIFVILFGIFPVFAERMPGILEGAGWSFIGAVRFHAMTPDSIIGIPTRVFCDLVLGFMIYSVVLKETGGGKFFTDLANSLMGRVRGGAAKVSVLSSAFFGSLSGSPIANIVTTGAVTIPAMKSTGYPSHYAAAVEACSSSGGAILPPVMGAVAFIMASFLNVPYSKVVVAAIIPSLLYFFGIFIQIDGFAAKGGFKGLAKEEIPSFKDVIKNGWIYLFSVVLLVYLLFAMRREAQAPFVASLGLLVLSMFKKETRIKPSDFYNIIMNTLKLLSNMLGIMAGIGLVLGGLSMTGVAVAFSSELVRLVGESPILLLLIGALVSFVLGIGMTISACYIFLAIVFVPALIPLGFDPMAAHLFVVYCGLYSFITPPVALGSYTAAGIANADPWVTSIDSMQLGFVKYFVPFFFVLDPALILRAPFVETIIPVLTAFMGVFLMASAIEGYLVTLGKLRLIQRFVFLAGGVLLFMPGLITNCLGFFFAGIVYIISRDGVKTLKSMES